MYNAERRNYSAVRADNTENSVDLHRLQDLHAVMLHYTVALLVDLNADSKHYFSVRHSVARLELSASASEVIRHAGAI